MLQQASLAKAALRSLYSMSQHAENVSVTDEPIVGLISVKQSAQCSSAMKYSALPFDALT
jgi:hypothetical protein